MKAVYIFNDWIHQKGMTAVCICIGITFIYVCICITIYIYPLMGSLHACLPRRSFLMLMRAEHVGETYGMTRSAKE